MTSVNRSSSRVIVPLDGSPASATAIPIARAVAAQLGGSVEILHVTEQPPADARRRLRLTEYGAADIPLREAAGDPVDVILATAADPAVALVVLTTHGRELEVIPRLGSVAEAVAARTEQPVLLVRPEAAADRLRAERGLHRLLFPVDGSPATSVTLRPATRLCGLLHASIDLLYVAAGERQPPSEPGAIATPRYIDQSQYEWAQWSSEVIERLIASCAACPPGVEVRAYVRAGTIGDEIVRFATEHDYDAIVLARRSHLEPGRAATLRAVLHSATCPILIVGAVAPVVSASKQSGEARAGRGTGRALHR
jgi:nucleotide-binding universal stress UspA family protein